MIKLLVKWIAVSGLLLPLVWFLGCSDNPTRPDLSGSGSEAGNTKAFGMAGRLVYADGSPVSGAAVYLVGSGGTSYIPDTTKPALKKPITTSEADGRYVLRDVPAGSYTFLAMDSGTKSVLIKQVMPKADTFLVLPTDTLLPSGAVKGRGIVSCQPSCALPGFYVFSLETGQYADFKNLGEGEFIINALPRGSHTIRFLSNSRDYSGMVLESVQVQPGDTTDLGDILFVPVDSLGNDSAFVSDTLAMRAILDSNGISRPVKEAVIIADGRIKFIYMPSANICRLPSEIGRLSALEYIQMGNLNLGMDTIIKTLYLDPEIGQLDSLKWLSVRNCPVPSLPDELANLRNLSCLEFAGCGLDSIPSLVFDLPSLMILSLPRNNFSDLPDEIMGLNCKIGVDNNSLCDVSVELSGWLDQHAIDYNPLDTLGWRETQVCP